MRPIPFLLLLAIAANAAPPPEQVISLEVSAGRADRRETPILYELPAPLRAAGSLTLRRDEDGRPVDLQRLPGGAGIVWLLEAPLRAGAVRRYRLEAVAARPAEPDVEAGDDGRAVRISVRKRPALVYQHATLRPPAGIEETYSRGGFLHPLYSPSGLVLTDDFPPDHAHQHGIFFAWVHTTFEGREVDFWNQAKELGDVRHAALGPVAGGPVFGTVEAELEHFDRTAPGGTKAVLRETWRIRVYDTAAGFLIDLESEQRTAGASPLAIEQYHYGGMAARGAREWYQQPESGFLTSEGKTRAGGNHTPARWVEMHGRIGGAPAGFAVLSHPGNFRSPTPVRLHPDKPYFCFSPMVNGAFTIRPGEVYRSRYRIWAHDGSPSAETNERLWADYADPPRVTVIR